MSNFTSVDYPASVVVCWADADAFKTQQRDAGLIKSIDSIYESTELTPFVELPPASSHDGMTEHQTNGHGDKECDDEG